MKYTPKLLAQLEEFLAQNHCQVRYEKGNFKAGYCLLNQNKVVVINKYYTIEGKINTLMEVIQLLRQTPESLTLSEAQEKIWQKLKKANTKEE